MTEQVLQQVNSENEFAIDTGLVDSVCWDISPQIRDAPLYSVARLFAYGTYSDWDAARDEYPTLSETHILKLRLLTLLTMALASSVLVYDDIRAQTGVATDDDVERLLLALVQRGAARVRIDSMQRRANIDAVLKMRNVYAGANPPYPSTLTAGHVLALLDGWSDRIAAARAGLAASRDEI